jgi:PIN domain nuclease of toxin-antitoxin system
MAMSSGLLLDTHIWLWLENKELKFTEALKARLEDAASSDSIYLCSFSLYEIANAFRRNRVDLHVSPEVWFDAAFRGRSVRLIDITPAISVEAANLPKTFHGDPGDRIIAATAMVENLTLLTNDNALLRLSKQGVLKTVKVNKIRSKDAR